MDLDLGRLQQGRGAQLGDVELPPWALNSPREFIRQHRLALESNLVSEQLHLWIDLIFGAKQRGAAALAANNLFYHLTYEDVALEELSKETDPARRASMELQIGEFGQTPTQLFTTPHPPRNAMIRGKLEVPVSEKAKTSPSADKHNVAGTVPTGLSGVTSLFGAKSFSLFQAVASRTAALLQPQATTGPQPTTNVNMKTPSSDRNPLMRGEQSLASQVEDNNAKVISQPIAQASAADDVSANTSLIVERSVRSEHSDKVKVSDSVQSKSHDDSTASNVNIFCRCLTTQAEAAAVSHVAVSRGTDTRLLVWVSCCTDGSLTISQSEMGEGCGVEKLLKKTFNPTASPLSMCAISSDSSLVIGASWDHRIYA